MEKKPRKIPVYHVEVFEGEPETIHSVSEKPMSMYNEDYLAQIYLERNLPAKDLKAYVYLLKGQDTVIHKTVTLDTLTRRFWEFQQNHRQLNIAEDYYLGDVNIGWVRAENIYFEGNLPSRIPGDTLDFNLKFKYRGVKDPNRMWVNVW